MTRYFRASESHGVVASAKAVGPASGISRGGSVVASVVAGLGAVLMLAGCGASAPPVESVGEISTCPGEFLEYLEKKDTTQGLDATAVDVGAQTMQAVASFDPVCVAARTTTRTLPSGAIEPPIYTALISTSTATYEDVLSALTAEGYTAPDGWTPEASKRIRLTGGTGSMSLDLRLGHEVGLTGDSTSYILIDNTTNPS
jgi:hypothetical protein